jgi:hypothetical protein
MNRIPRILKILRIYFDSCCYGRPRDDQTQPTIETETIAIGGIINICGSSGIMVGKGIFIVGVVLLLMLA